MHCHTHPALPAHNLIGPEDPRTRGAAVAFPERFSLTRRSVTLLTSPRRQSSASCTVRTGCFWQRTTRRQLGFAMRA